jgi:oligopeptide transport system permease protein
MQGSDPQIITAGRTRRRFRRNRAGIIGLALLSAIVAACAGSLPFSTAPVPGDQPAARQSPRYIYQQYEDYLQAPSARHPFGTDALGRDLSARTLYAGSMSLAIGLLSAAVAVVIGVAVGTVSGYTGGWLDATLMRIVDILYSLPYILVVILLTVVFDRQWWIIFLAIGAVSWLTMARVIRGQVLALKARPFIESAKALGLPAWRIIATHVLPNLIGPIVVYATLTVPQAILQESFLSFLGLGMPRDEFPTWGSLAAEGVTGLQPGVRIYWWLVLFPCGFLSLTLLSLNFLGDALRDAADPRSTGTGNP